MADTTTTTTTDSTAAASDLGWITKTLNILQTAGAASTVISFVTSNAPLLERLGQELFQEIIGLVQSGNKEAARLKLIGTMSLQELTALKNANATELQAYVTAHEQFIADVEKFGMQLLPVLAQVGVKVATGGVL
jgi:hypothetical protein